MCQNFNCIKENTDCILLNDSALLKRMELFHIDRELFNLLDTIASAKSDAIENKFLSFCENN